jgi:serine/threonine protein kinase
MSSSSSEQLPEHFGPFSLIRQLGKGGIGRVYLAIAQTVGGQRKLLAVKRLVSAYNKDPELISMLADEARISIWLHHPNIVQVFDFGQIDGAHYIAMEFIDGCDLHTLIRGPRGSHVKGQALPIPTALFVALRVAEALDQAHRARDGEGRPLRTIHRDVSPHNVMLSRAGEVKLTDFGLARTEMSTHKTRAGIVRGKFAYMPKEQAHGAEIDHRIDIFAAGVTLYESLTGVRPYTSTNIAQQLYQLEQTIPPPSSRIDGISNEIDAIVERAIQPDPEPRYQHARELARDLRRALLACSSPSQEAGRLARLVRRAAPRPAATVESLPRLEIAEVKPTDASLIADAVLAAQRTIVSLSQGALESVDGEANRAKTPAWAAAPADLSQRGTIAQPDHVANGGSASSGSIALSSSDLIESETPPTPADRTRAKVPRQKTRPGTGTHAADLLPATIIDQAMEPATARSEAESGANAPAASDGAAREGATNGADPVSDGPERRKSAQHRGRRTEVIGGTIDNSQVLKTHDPSAAESTSSATEEPQSTAPGLVRALRKAANGGRQRNDAALSAFQHALARRADPEYDQETAFVRPPGNSAHRALFVLLAIVLVAAGLVAGWLLRSRSATEGAGAASATAQASEGEESLYPLPWPPAKIGDDSALEHSGASDREARSSYTDGRRKRRVRRRTRAARATRQRGEGRTSSRRRRSRKQPTIPEGGGSLVVTSKRRGIVLLNDKRSGRTPARLGLEAGIYRVKILYDDKTESAVKFLTIDAGSKETLSF